jgi:hypothetical protein
MDETTQGVRTDDSEQPQNQQNHENGPKHDKVLSSLTTGSTPRTIRMRTITMNEHAAVPNPGDTLGSENKSWTSRHESCLAEIRVISSRAVNPDLQRD